MKQKILLLFSSVCLLVSCQAQSTIPMIKDTVLIDGQLKESAWSNAFVFKDEQESIRVMQDTDWVYLAVPILNHKDMPQEKELTKPRLSYVELHVKTRNEIYILHASSMNGEKLAESKKDFEWNDFDHWKANSEGVRKGDKVVYAEAYEFRIEKKWLGADQLSIMANVIPFYNDAFPSFYVPAQNNPPDLDNWVIVKL